MQNKSTISPQWKPIQVSREMQSQTQVEKKKKDVVMMHLILWSVVLSWHAAVHLFDIYSMYPTNNWLKFPPHGKSKGCFDTELLPREKMQGRFPVPCALDPAGGWDSWESGRQGPWTGNSSKTPFPYPQLMASVSCSWGMGPVDFGICNFSQPLPPPCLCFHPPTPTSDSFFFCLATLPGRNKQGFLRALWCWYKEQQGTENSLPLTTLLQPLIPGDNWNPIFSFLPLWVIIFFTVPSTFFPTCKAESKTSLNRWFTVI